VEELVLTFRKLVLLSVLTVLLGVSLVYMMGYIFRVQSSQQTKSTWYTYAPPLIGPYAPMASPLSGKLLVYAYSGGNSVQASVTITGPQDPNPPLNNSVPVGVTTLNRTTSTDLQNPLIFDGMWAGKYSVIGTYGSEPPQNETVKVPVGDYCDVFLNFGSVSLPPLGHIFVAAWYTGNKSRGDSQTISAYASVTISGPESHNGTTNASFWSPLMFTVAPGEYSVVGMYESWPLQKQTVSVTAGSGSPVVFIFGDEPWHPPP
jgi:hypothetical protein